jgi:hypothetical protein
LNLYIIIASFKFKSTKEHFLNKFLIKRCTNKLSHSFLILIFVFKTEKIFKIDQAKSLETLHLPDEEIE